MGLEAIGDAPQDWTAWVSASALRHHVLGEPLLDWLHQPIVTEEAWFAAQRPKQRITRRRFLPCSCRGWRSALPVETESTPPGP